MQHPVTGFRIPPAAVAKLAQLADAADRPRSHFLASLILALEPQPDGSLCAHLPCPKNSNGHKRLAPSVPVQSSDAAASMAEVYVHDTTPTLL
jgi:hypothetical protein